MIWVHFDIESFVFIAQEGDLAVQQTVIAQEGDLAVQQTVISKFVLLNAEV